MNQKTIETLMEEGFFSGLDIHFARFMMNLSGGDSPGFFLAAALTSRARSQGNVCLDLASAAGRALEAGRAEKIVCPSIEDWILHIESNPVVGRPGEYKPLILDGTRLYLYRYWDYEKKLADFIRSRAIGHEGHIDVKCLKDGLDRLFPPEKSGETDWQRVAAVLSVAGKFCVISGGPGTGKTFTVAKILALLLEQPGARNLRIALTAPTGKAAQRLKEAIRGVRDQIDCKDHVKASIPDDASTIHRLLGAVPGSPYFRYNAENPLPVDVVVVDEASMVDLALLSKLTQAIPGDACLILLGDRNQLASVEAGAILGDICDSGKIPAYSPSFKKLLKETAGIELNGPEGRREGGLIDSIVELKKSYRFGAGSGIGPLSRAVNEGNGEKALTFLRSEQYTDIRWKEIPPPDILPRAMKDLILSAFAGGLKTTDPNTAFDLFSRFRILSALREGPYGVHALNLIVEKVLRGEKLVRRDGVWYAGRPVMITENDYNLGLFNGDVGIVLPDPDNRNELRVFFLLAEGTLRKFEPLRLPSHETVYAMTVHKSQGSEFVRVLLMLSDRPSPVLTRELIYTAITRAKEHVEIWGSETVFAAAVSRRIERASGLRDILWK
jgi:exodeoxyribonuclease V alpha subunit